MCSPAGVFVRVGRCTFVRRAMFVSLVSPFEIDIRQARNHDLYASGVAHLGVVACLVQGVCKSD